MAKHVWVVTWLPKAAGKNVSPRRDRKLLGSLREAVFFVMEQLDDACRSTAQIHVPGESDIAHLDTIKALHAQYQNAARDP
jgi:hypothetical protein